MRLNILFQSWSDSPCLSKSHGAVDPFRESIPVRSLTSLVLASMHAFEANIINDLSLSVALDGLAFEVANSLRSLLERCPFPTAVLSPCNQASMVDGRSVWTIPADFAAVDSDDFVLKTANNILFVPQTIEILLRDYHELMQKNSYDPVLSPVPLSGHPDSNLLSSNLRGRFTPWVAKQGLDSTMLVSGKHFSNLRKYFTQGSDSWAKGATSSNLKTLYPLEPLAVPLPMYHQQNVSFWQHCYEKTLMMPPDYWIQFHGHHGAAAYPGALIP